MATTTTNYGLTKPEGSDFYDIGVQNDNMDIIDKQMKANAKDIAQLNSDLKDALVTQYAELKFKFHYDSINSRPKIIPLFKPKNVSILSTSSKFNISFLSLIIYFCNTSYFRRFRLLSIPYIFCTIMGRQKPPNFSS